MFKYKVGDYIVVTGKCADYLLGKTVKIQDIYGDHYMIDTMRTEDSYYPIWTKEVCENNSYININMMILFADKLTRD